MIRRLLHYSSPTARRLLIAVLAGSVIIAVLQGIAFLLLVPLLRALFDGDLAVAEGWLLVMCVVGVAYALVYWVVSRLGIRASTAVLESLLTRLGDRLVDLPVAWFGTDRSGMATGIATQGAMFVATTPYSFLRQIIAGFLAPATVLVGMWFFDWRLALAMTVMVPVMAVSYRWLQGRIARGDAAHSRAVSEASNRVIEFARVQPALRTADENSIADRLVNDALLDQHRSYRGMLATGGAGIATFNAIVQTSLTVVLILGAYLAIGGSVDPVTLIGLLVLAVRFNEPIMNAGGLGGSLAVAQTTLDQFDCLAAIKDLPEPSTPQKPEDWSIRFDDVTFGYGHAPVLEGLSFAAPAGKMTAVVGPSGSGKTTITKLIARYYDPDSGIVSIGGVPLHELGTATVAAAVAPVFQDVYLFDDTLLGNVWIGNPDLDRDQVISAATRARGRRDRRPGCPAAGTPVSRRRRDEPVRGRAATGVHCPSLAQGRPGRAARRGHLRARHRQRDRHRRGDRPDPCRPHADRRRTPAADHHDRRPDRHARRRGRHRRDRHPHRVARRRWLLRPLLARPRHCHRLAARLQ